MPPAPTRQAQAKPRMRGHAHMCAGRNGAYQRLPDTRKDDPMPVPTTADAQNSCGACSTNGQPADQASLEQARAYFSHDLFASEQCGAQVDEAAPGRAVCSFEILPCHRNAMGAVMGGAVFTLADFALAVASNFSQPPSVTVSSSIEFVSAPKGARLVATCLQDRAGRRLGFYTTRVEDERGTLVALVQATCMRVQ